VGQITSVAIHHEAGPIALAIVKRGTDPVATLTAMDSDGGRVSATQVPIVNPEGVSEDRPAGRGSTQRPLLGRTAGGAGHRKAAPRGIR
jgi:hypothetical protein